MIWQYIGVFGLSLVYPLDTVKVRIQTRPHGTYSGIYNCLHTIVHNEGYSSLYRGLASPVIGYGAIKAVAFGSNKYVCDHFTAYYNGRRLYVYELVLAGGIAGIAQTFIRAPVEQIKVVMQSRYKLGSNTAPPYTNTFACLKDVVKTEGIGQGLYRSFWPTLWRVCATTIPITLYNALYNHTNNPYYALYTSAGNSTVCVIFSLI